MKYNIAWTIGLTIPALIIGCDPIINLIMPRGRGRGVGGKGTGSGEDGAGSGKWGGLPSCPTWLPSTKVGRGNDKAVPDATLHFVSCAQELV